MSCGKAMILTVPICFTELFEECARGTAILHQSILHQLLLCKMCAHLPSLVHLRYSLPITYYCTYTMSVLAKICTWVMLPSQESMHHMQQTIQLQQPWHKQHNIEHSLQNVLYNILELSTSWFNNLPEPLQWYSISHNISLFCLASQINIFL